MVNNKIENFHECTKPPPYGLELPVDIVFFGRPGSGKITALKTIGNHLIFASGHAEVEGLNKRVEEGMDYTEHRLDKGPKLRLYVTPGQKRYNDLHFKAVAKAHIYITLIDLSSVAPFAEFMHYKKIIDVSGNEEALRIVAFTHYDMREHSLSQLSKEIRKKCNSEVLTLRLDVRCKNEMQSMLEMAINLKFGQMLPHLYYAQNNLFLKDINQ